MSRKTRAHDIVCGFREVNMTAITNLQKDRTLDYPNESLPDTTDRIWGVPLCQVVQEGGGVKSEILGFFLPH